MQRADGDAAVTDNNAAGVDVDGKQANSAHLRSWPFVLISIGAAVALFGTPSRLAGPLLYDDKAAILRNPVVTGADPLSRVWLVDFWGENELQSPASHKSWRPLVTLSFRANFDFHGPEPFYYHAINCGLHACVSALVEPTVRTAFGDEYRLGAALSALLFAVHPVHAEAVQNLVGRAELMMATLFLSGFLSYARIAANAPPAASPLHFHWRHVLAPAVALLFTLGATLCKETGATLPALCAAWDALVLCQLHARDVLLAITIPVASPLLRPGVLPPRPSVRCQGGWAGLFVRVGALSFGAISCDLLRSPAISCDLL